jgi:hypothetical protein
VEHYHELGLDPQNDEAYQRAAQCFALVTLYLATGGEMSWDKADFWLESKVHECKWHGCCCGAKCTNDISVNDETGSLATLDLRNNGLEYSLPREIGILTNL